ncbi:TetR/AcrR family transcriptional regulator [Microbacterium aurum]
MSNKIGERLSPTARRAQILDIATAHFAREGVTGASMSAIAREAGVTRALVYHYFSGKNELLAGVLTRQSERLFLAAAPPPGLAPRAAVEYALLAYFAHVEVGSELVRIVEDSPDSSRHVLVELSAATHAAHTERIMQIAKTPDTPEARLAVGAWIVFVQFVARSTTGAGAAERERAADLCLNTLEGALGNPLDTRNRSGAPASTTL